MVGVHPEAGKTTLLAQLLAANGRRDAEFLRRPLTHFKPPIVTQEADGHWTRRMGELDIPEEALNFQRGRDGYPRPFWSRPTPKQWREFAQHLIACYREYGFDLMIIDTLAEFWRWRTRTSRPR